jgi:hypothetical protein
MNTETSKYADSRCWKQFYRAAILENDDSRVPGRVTEAEQAIVARARELFQTSGDYIEERESLDNAMYALHALETSWRHRATGPSSISATPRSSNSEKDSIVSWDPRNAVVIPPTFRRDGA